MASIEFLITSFLAIILFASLVSIRSKLPYTIVLVLIGITLVFLSESLLLTNIPSIEDTISALKSYTVGLTGGTGGGLFVALVVPPLIFEALTNVRSNDLREIIRPSVVLATVGVLIATLVTSFVLWQIIGLPFYISILFAAIISPTDTATVLELFRRVKVPSKLSALLDTEAAFNDATGIVIFTIILTFITTSQLSFLRAATSFFFIFGGGVAVGLVVALGAELLTSLVTDRLTEVILTISAVYGSYVAASSFGFSGLVAVSIVALYFGNFTVRSTIKPSNREAIRLFWEIAAFVGNSVAFLFIGLTTDVLKLSQSIELIIIAYLTVLASRAATVYPILTVFDRAAKTVESKIPLKWRNVAFLAGVRGALSIALVASLTAVTSLSVLSSADVDTISTLVLGVAFISIILQSAILSRYIRGRFPESKEQQEEELSVRFARTVSAIDALQKLRSDNKISDGEFADQLEQDRNELGDLLDEMNKSLDPASILKSRATFVYSSLTSRLASTIKSSRNSRTKKVEQISPPSSESERTGEKNEAD